MPTLQILAVLDLTQAVAILYTVQAKPFSRRHLHYFHRLSIKGSDTPSVKAPGLPNITGTVCTNAYYFGNYDATGAMWASSGNGSRNTGDDGGSNTKINFNASRSSSIYGASTTVQPNSINLIAQIKF